MSRALAIVGGLLFAASLLFFAASYAWRFGGGGVWSWNVARPAVSIDLLMFTGFALHHSIFARTGVKHLIERLAPPHLERSIYVWIASALFFVVCAAWRPVPGVLWRVSDGPAWMLHAVQLTAAIFTVVAARRRDVLALSGVRQVIEHEKQNTGAPDVSSPPSLDDRGPYGVVRHPIYLGWFLMVWCSPVMNDTRLAFAAISCLYLVVAIPLEERELRRAFGEAYARYAATVRWRVIPFIY